MSFFESYETSGSRFYDDPVSRSREAFHRSIDDPDRDRNFDLLFWDLLVLGLPVLERVSCELFS